MAGEFGIRIVGIEALQRKLRDPRLLGGPLRTFFERAGAITAGNVRERTPVDTGRLRNSITHEVDRGAIPQHVRIGTVVKYARWVEEGRKPGKFPPLAAMQPWARRHGFPAGRGGAFLVARAIAQHGTKPRQMFSKGLSASLNAIRGLVGDLSREIERRWGAV